MSASLRATPLRLLKVGRATGGRYALEVERLVAFWRSVGVWPEHLRELDDAVGEYVEHLWHCNGLCSTARYAVAGVQHLLPSSRRHLDHAWSLVRTMQRLQPPCRALPMSPQLALALAALAEEARAPDVACLVLVGFVGLLRSSELFRLLGDDVQVHADFAVVRLLDTKVGQREGRAKMVTIESAIALHSLRRRLLAVRDGPLSGRTPYQLRQSWRALLGHFGLHASTRGTAFGEAVRPPTSSPTARWRKP